MIRPVCFGFPHILIAVLAFGWGCGGKTGNNDSGSQADTEPDTDTDDTDTGDTDTDSDTNDTADTDDSGGTDDSGDTAGDTSIDTDTGDTDSDDTGFVSPSDYRFVGEKAEDNAGHTVANAGDVDNDGLDDLLIGAPNNSDAGSEAGKAYLVLGASLTADRRFNLADADYTFVAEDEDDQAGYALSSAGDVDGDGYDDVLIGAYKNDADSTFTGKVYLFLGANLDATSALELANADVVFVGEEGADYAGKSVASAGDVDNDGLDDILIGATGNDDGGSTAGKVYLVLGASLGASTEIDLADADYSFVGEGSGYLVGTSVSSAGDVDNDGLDDLLIGSLKDQAYLILGSSLGVSSQISLAYADTIFISEISYDFTGYSVSGVGDVDGDGLDDVLIGAYKSDGDGTELGKAYLVLGASLGSSASIGMADADYSFVGEADNDYAGYSVSGAGDVDDDGLADLLIGAYANDQGGESAGKAYVVLGASLGSTTEFSLIYADHTFVGEHVGDYTGKSVSGAGDVDGDGHHDLLLGAHGDDEGGNDAGAAYLLLGAEL